MRRLWKRLQGKSETERKKQMDRNKAKGMLWGLIVGDAFGSPIQFSGKDSHPWITEMVKCPVFNLPAGYWTDDSSMAFCVMERALSSSADKSAIAASRDSVSFSEFRRRSRLEHRPSYSPSLSAARSSSSI